MHVSTTTVFPPASTTSAWTRVEQHPLVVDERAAGPPVLGQHGIGRRGADQERTRRRAVDLDDARHGDVADVPGAHAASVAHAASDTGGGRPVPYARPAVSITAPQVNGVENNVLPGGGEGPGVYFGGRHQIAQLWCDEGDCG